MWFAALKRTVVSVKCAFRLNTRYSTVQPASLASALSHIYLRRSRSWLVFVIAVVAILIGNSNTASAAAPTLTFQGTGADAGISFQFDSPVPLNTPGLLTTFSFNSCTVPAGETCDQVNFSAGSGVIRFVGITSSGLDIRTFEFDNFTNNGTYSTLATGSPNSGIVTVTGSTDAFMVLSPISLPPGTYQTAYTQMIVASGGSSPYAYKVTPINGLPPGLTLSSSDGVLSGTPTAAGSFSFNVTAKDAGGNTGSQAYTLNIGNTFIVTTPSDDATGTSSNCPGPNCSLRDALAAAAADSPGTSDEITFDQTTFPTGPGAAAQIINLDGALMVGSNVSILGPGANLLTISGQNKVHVMNVNSGLVVSISGLTIVDGNTVTDGGGDGNGHGGGIYNAGALILTNSALAGNSASDGGGIYNIGTLEVTNSTLSGNSASSDGGGVDNEGTLTLINSTQSGNSASKGGGTYNAGTLTVSNSTLSANSGSSDGGGIDDEGTLTLINSIVSTNTSSNGADLYAPSGTYTVSGGNLIGDGNIALASLDYYGGPTQTMPPLPSSPALNAGMYEPGEPSTDQRGATRPATAKCGGRCRRSAGYRQFADGWAGSTCRRPDDRRNCGDDIRNRPR